MHKVLVPLAEGFEEIEAIIIIDVLRRAGVEVISAALIDGPIIASRGTRHLADVILDDVLDENFNMIVLPGGADGARALESDPRIKSLLCKAHKAGQWIAAICAAPNVLRSFKIIEANTPFTLHPGTLDWTTGGQYLPEERVVKHGQVITSIGPGSAFEFALQLVEELCGQDIRHKIAAPLHLP